MLSRALLLATVVVLSAVLVFALTGADAATVALDVMAKGDRLDVCRPIGPIFLLGLLMGGVLACIGAVAAWHLWMARQRHLMIETDEGTSVWSERP